MNKNYNAPAYLKKNQSASRSMTKRLSGSITKISLLLVTFFMAVNLQAQVSYSSIVSGSLSLTKNTNVIVAFAAPVPANTVVYINVDDASNLSFDVGTTNTGTNGSIKTTTQYNGPNLTDVVAITSTSSFQYVKISLSGNHTATVNAVFYTALNIADCGTPIATSVDQSALFTSNNNTQYAIDNDLGTASDFSLSIIGAGTLTQTIILNGPSNLGDGVSILYQIPAGIDVSVFSGISFQAYSGSTPVGSAQTLTNIISVLGLLTDHNKTRLTFYPDATSTSTFDRIQISFNFGISVGIGAQALIYDVERVPAVPLLSNASYSVCSPVVGNAVATPAQNINGAGPLTYTWYNADGTPVTGGTTSTADNISTIPLATLLGTTTPAAGTYTFTVKVHKAGCTADSTNPSPSSTQTVVVNPANTSTPTLLPSAASLNLVTAACADANGYIAFVDPSNVSKKYISVNPNGNTGYNFKFGIAINNLLTLTSISGNAASAIGPRLFSVIDYGTPPYTTNGGMKVRIYYTPADTTAARGLVNTVLGAVHGGGILSNSWFKVPGLASTLSGLLSPTGITNAINLTSKATYGTEGTQQYVEFSGIQSFSTFGFVAANGTSAILPVTGLSLTGSLIAGVPQLSWSTITEVNSSYFSVESSTDASTFTDIGKVAAAGNSSSILNYAYTDRSATGTVVYYRIKAVNKDGNVSYSNTIAMNLSGIASSFKVFPNPVSNLLNIQTSVDGTYLVELYSIDGKRVQSSQLTTGGGIMSLNINKVNVPTGVYSVKVTNTNGKSVSSYSTVLIK